MAIRNRSAAAPRRQTAVKLRPLLNRELALDLVGLFASTFATRLPEILDSRLLSVVTWYHLPVLAAHVDR